MSSFRATMNKRRVAMIVMALAAVAGFAGIAGERAAAAPPFCEVEKLPPGLNGCLPTPLECATGNYNGNWQGGSASRSARCLGGGGHIEHYSAGSADTKHEICGTIIDKDQLGTSNTGWLDPNICPPASNDPGYGVKGRAVHRRIAKSSSKGVVASISPLAAQAGTRVLDKGGNAIDAAVATIFAVGVTRPAMCGIGGGGFLVYRGADGATAALDFRETAPATLTAEKLWVNGINREGSGHLVVGVPGTVAGMAAALDRYGTMPLAEVIAPAEKMARKGIAVTPGFSTDYRLMGFDVPNEKRLRRFPAAAEIYLLRDPSQSQYSPLAGSTLVQTDYANSLALIAKNGAAAFYRGRIAKQIVAAMEASRLGGDASDHGVMTAEDLSSYRAIWREPLIGSYRGREIVAMPPPSAGGIVTLETLNIVENYQLGGENIKHSSADYFHFFAEAHKIAWADRTAYIADPDPQFADVPTEWLTSKAYADQRRSEINPNLAKGYQPGVSPDGQASSAAAEGIRAGQTTHVSVVDAKGNAVAVTCSIEQGFGSAVVAPGTGFLLNNTMTDFTEDPASVNRVEGGKRPRSASGPTIVAEDNNPVLVTGAGGGPYVPMSTILSVSNVVDFGMDVAHAVDAARLFSFTCCTLELENGRVHDLEQAKLASRGHVFNGPLISGLYGEYNWQFPFAQAAGVDVQTGARLATSDPRTEGGAAAQP